MKENTHRFLPFAIIITLVVIFAQINSPTFLPFLSQIDWGFWGAGLLILAVPYILWKLIAEDIKVVRQFSPRGYQIVYHDIGRLKKKERKSKVNLNPKKLFT